MLQITYSRGTATVVLSSGKTVYATIALFQDGNTILADVKEGDRDVTLFFDISEEGKLVFVAANTPESEYALARFHTEMTWPWVRGNFLDH
jgi:hypothetical protein